jgi:hypothetical protein
MANSRSRKFDPAQHSVEALVRTAGGGDKAVPAPQDFLRIRDVQGWSRQPAQFKWNLQLCGRVIERAFVAKCE